MNALLKAILKEGADLFLLGEDVLQKKGYALILPALLQAGTDSLAIIANGGDLHAELSALISNPAADSDLLSYAAGLFGGSDDKAQKVISAAAKLALDVALDVSGLVGAIKS